MENNIINIGNALGWSIIHSIWQAAIWYIIYSLYILMQPQITAKGKHNVAFGTQVSIFISFILTFIYFYQIPNQLIDLRNINPQDLRNIVLNYNEDGFQIENLLPYVVIGYVLGFIIQVLLLTNSLLRIRILKFKGLDSIPENWTSLYYKAKKKLNVTQSVGIYLSNKVSVPITLGHIKPFILFPIAYANKMDLAQVEAILLHELAHVKRQDYFLNLLKVGIETLMFFNPFVWALSKVIEREREHACDDMVVQHISTPISYAQALVELEELRMSLNPALTLAATGKKNHLLNRIKRITKMETNYKNVRPQLLAVLLSGVALLTLAILIPINEIKAEESKNGSIEAINFNHIKLDTVKPKALQPLAPKSPPAEESKIVYKGNVITDTTELPIAVRNTLRSIEANSKKIQAYYDSPEWKEKIEKISSNAKRVEEQFNTPEWKAQVKAMEENGKKVSAYFESAEWKNKMSNIEKEASKADEYFNSPEWKEQIKKIEENGKKIASYFESDEWKNQMSNIEKETAKVQEHFNSPEWKRQIKKIEEDGKKIQEYFESPEWKQKAKEWEKLQNSPEYKEINKKYQKEVEELKNKKDLSKI